MIFHENQNVSIVTSNPLWWPGEPGGSIKHDGLKFKSSLRYVKDL